MMGVRFHGRWVLHGIVDRAVRDRLDFEREIKERETKRNAGETMRQSKGKTIKADACSTAFCRPV
jgi:hypothetical protein